MLLEIIITGLIGPITAIFIFRVISELIYRPKLIVEPIEKPGEEPPEIQPLRDRHRAFYHVNVKNEGRTPAKNLKPKLVFFNKDGNRVCGFSAKWNFNPQPIRYELTQGGRLIPIPETSLIPPRRTHRYTARCRRKLLHANKV